MKVLLLLLSAVGSAICWAPCSQITHSECRLQDKHIFLKLDVPDKAGCEMICEAYGERCSFSIFDHDAYGHEGNCRLCDEDFSKNMIHCNMLTGPKTETHGCNYTNPPDQTCQIFRNGNCHFDTAPEEILLLESWEHCQKECDAISQCTYWHFLREEGECHIMYSSEKTCTWEISPRKPHFEDCDRYFPETASTPTFIPSITSTKTASTSTSIPTTTESPCITVGGQEVGVPCVFPFIAGGKTYSGCTFSGGYSEPWCATAVDASGVILVGHWGNCPLDDSSCPIDES